MTEQECHDLARQQEIIDGYRSPDDAAELRRRLREVQDDQGMMRIYICSMYGSRGNIETNLELAKMYCMNVIEGGNIPICPHVFLSPVLRDDIPSQRAAGLRIGLAMLEDCDVLLICSGISEGMKEEIKKAWRMGIPVEIMDMTWLHGEDQGMYIEEEIRKELEELYGKEHHTEAH